MIKDDCCAQPGLMLPNEAISIMRQQVTPLSDTEWVELESSVDRVLAEDVLSPLDLPPFANSAMDGYALRAADAISGQSLQVVGRAMAGQPYVGECLLGQCVRIMTGAEVPQGLDTVEMQEQVELQDDKAVFMRELQAGQYVRAQGSELKKGTPVLSAGSVIGSAEIGMLATLGIASVPVRPKLKVVLFSTGDELKPPGTQLAAGEIYDSNRPALRVMLQKMRAEVIDLGVIEDDRDAVKAAFAKADELGDLVVTSGGASVGEADFIHSVLAEMGEVNFWKLAIKPGKPFAFGRLPNSWFCGLPGNPVSALVTCYQLVQPLIQHLAGETQKAPLMLKARLKGNIRKSSHRQEFQRGLLSRNADGELQVESTGSQSSDRMTSLTSGNCFIIVPLNTEAFDDGDWVDVEPFNASLGGI